MRVPKNVFVILIADLQAVSAIEYANSFGDIFVKGEN